MKITIFTIENNFVKFNHYSKEKNVNLLTVAETGEYYIKNDYDL